MPLKITYHSSKRGRHPVDVDSLRLKIYYEAPKALNNEQLAVFLGIHVATFYDLIKENSYFNEAIKHYRGVSAIEVLDSFKKIAVGYTADEVTKELKREEGVMKMVTTKIVTKHFKPDAQAGMFYLKNQMPEQFKDKTETVITPGAGIESITFTAKRRESDE